MDFQRRATRTRFWMFVLFNFIAGGVIGGIAGIIPALAFLGPVYNLAVLLPGLAICARRLHDTDRKRSVV